MTPVRKLLVTGVAVLGAAGAIAIGALAVRAVRDPVGPAPPGGFEAMRAGAEYEGAASCGDCHRGHVESWARTFHRTMTQEATPESVVAPFDGRSIDVLGARTTAWREGDRFFMDTVNPLTGTMETLPIVRTVGSRRIQQYVTRIGDKHVRLPLAWSMAEKRWFHLSEAFFHGDGSGFLEHAAVWDLNCIFCHNVKANPGALRDGSVASSVEELGIACEACHGPGEEHARRMRSPLRRYAFRTSYPVDPTIVNPGRLPQERSVQVCGHCHGQRVPANLDDVFRIFRDGDPYTPGEDLFRIWLPVTRDTKAGDIDFAPRFWKDGSPRLTAYEMQGVMASPCWADEQFTCLSCHAMHAGDPRGQLRPDLPGDAACVQCHDSLPGDHSRHAPASEGARCTSCHMPEVVYGIMTWHPTHQIDSPDPAAAASVAKPDACTACHVGRSRAWAQAQSDRLWPRRLRAVGASAPGSAAAPPAAALPAAALPAAAEIPRALFAGDALYRTLAAHRLGLPAPEPEAARLAVPLLAEALLDDYPNVRRTAAISLRALTGRDDVPDAHAPVDARRAFRDAVQARRVTGVPGWPFTAEGGVDRETIEAWKAAREEIPISVGE